MKSRDGFDKEFARTYETLFPLVFRIAYRITGDEGRAEDFCHESFIKYYERGNPLPDVEQAKYWLIRVVKNIALNGEKRKARERVAYERWQRMEPLRPCRRLPVPLPVAGMPPVPTLQRIFYAP